MSLVSILIIKYKWRFFWILRRTKNAIKFVNNINLVHRKYFCETVSKLDVNNILELGCGNGANIWILQQCLDRSHIQFHGVDISPAAIKVAQKRIYSYPSNVHFYNSECSDFLFKSDLFFDLVLVDAVFIYLSENEVSEIIKKISVSSKFLILHELVTNSSKSILSSHGFIHNYDIILQELSNVSEVVKLKSLRTENIWGACGYSYFIKFH